MASGSTCHKSNAKSNTRNISSPKSHFRKTVCLKDWWLEKPQNSFVGSRLAVAGITSREKQAVRVFSAPILRRYDVFTLETVDGVCVLIQGFMNKAQTAANGFPPEVFKHFVFGFPSYWEVYAGDCAKGKSPSLDVAKRTQDFEHLSPLSRCIWDFNVRSPQQENPPGRTCRRKNSEKCLKDTPLSIGNSIKKGEHKFTIQTNEDLYKAESSKKTLTEKSLTPTVAVEVKNYGEIQKVVYIFVCLIMSKEEKTMTKSGQLDGCTEAGKAEAASSNKSGDKYVYKQTENHGCAKGRTPCIHHTRRHLRSTVQEEKLSGVTKSSMSQHANLSAEKPGKREESSISEKVKVTSSVGSPLSPNLKRSRSGRLLLPMLEFWRNQRAVYDADRQITAIKDLDLDTLSGGSTS